MDEQSLGARIRQFLRDLFGSRLVDQLETELLRIRNDYESRLHERDEVIAEQRSRIAQLDGKIDRYELVLLPLSSPLGNLFKEKREPPSYVPLTEPSKASSWKETLETWDRQQSQEIEDEKSGRQAVGQQVPDEQVR